jgi:alpha-L-arabinofuranosidase
MTSKRCGWEKRSILLSDRKGEFNLFSFDRKTKELKQLTNCSDFPILNILHRNSDIVEIACRSNLVNSFCGGTIQTNAAGLYRIPSFYVMKLFSDHSKPVPLTLSETPRGLDVTACSSEDRASLCIFAVNVRKEPAELKLDLSAFGAGMKIVGG